MATGKQRTGLNPSAYQGVEASAPPQLLIMNRQPTPNDVARYNIGTLWVIRDPQEVWMLATVIAYAAKWIQLFPGAGGGATSFPCDAGTATEAGGVLEVHGEPLKNINTKGAGNIVTVALNDTVSITGSFHADGSINTDSDVSAVHDVTAGNDMAAGQTITAGHGVLVLADGIDSTGPTHLRDLASTPDALLKVDNTGLVSTVALPPAATTITTADGTLTNTYAAPNYDIQLSRGSNGQVMIGKTGDKAAWANINTSEGTLTTTAGTNTLDVNIAHGTKGTVLMGTGVPTAPVWGDIEAADASIVVDTSTTGKIKLASPGAGTTNKSFFSTQSTTQYYNLNPTATYLTNLTTLHDTTGGFNASTCTFTCPTKGIWEFTAYLYMTGAGGGGTGYSSYNNFWIVTSTGDSYRSLSMINPHVSYYVDPFGFDVLVNFFGNSSSLTIFIPLLVGTTVRINLGTGSSGAVGVKGDGEGKSYFGGILLEVT